MSTLKQSTRALIGAFKLKHRLMEGGTGPSPKKRSTLVENLKRKRLELGSKKTRKSLLDNAHYDRSKLHKQTTGRYPSRENGIRY